MANERFEDVVKARCWRGSEARGARIPGASPRKGRRPNVGVQQLRLPAAIRIFGKITRRTR